ncbi:hybrid sensor histidine kinase/response regulator transcription factor [Geofilum rubicundum]|uniref:histidine kinase n=1 Tax=Geofilum rubicundum JCM 15548 TaxID=1236989 RepID=A0A0E9LY64_9BACT|nr:hybrid sensor histidine kinase/response regulator transcription factor [Geofilum rubicundum]GAO30243.1 DNA-binding response regulator, AraC family [Geofilum rubicundum JCM 15548]
MDLKFVRVDEDGNGRMIMADSVIYYGSSNELWRFNTSSLEKKRVGLVNEAIGSHSISGLTLGESGALWIGIENRLIQYFPDKDSLASIIIDTGSPQKLMNLQVDARGDIWATTQQSIIRARARTNTYTTIPLYNNLPMKSFYGYASARLPTGHLLFGGDNGYIEMDPEQIKFSDERPEIFITGLSINNEVALPADSVGVLEIDMAFNERLKLKYNQNSVSFEFSTLDYLFPNVSQYSYRLRPVQENWLNTSGDKNFAVFANLKPGTYSFELRGTNHLGVWSEVKQVDIQISPSIWLSKGFLTFYILLIVLMTYGVFRIYSYRQRLRGELQLVRLEQQHSEAMYQSKIQFFTNISHEFRTPLSLIIPPIQELLNHHTLSQSQSRMLNMAHRNAQRLFKLVNQLLDFRKIESSGLELLKVKVELMVFLKRVFHSFDDMASRHEVDYRLELPEEPVIVDVDDEKLETIVFNLLSNAFKYTPFGGQIILRLGIEGQQVKIVVKDNGPGIPLEDQAHIFDRFYQSGTGKSQKVGSGIGLTLSKEYARLLGGTVSVDSAPEKGCEFVLWFPHHNQPHVEWLENPERIVPQVSIGAEKLPVEDMGTKDAQRIVLIDDNEDILDFMELNLRGRYQVHCAGNGQQGLDLVAKVHPHLIISDVMMPVMDGFVFCSLVKQNKATAHIPVILLTAKSLDLYKTEGMEKGADMYITKPFDMDYLKSCIASVFRRDKQLEDFFTRSLVLNPSTDGERTGGEEELFLKKVMAVIQNNISNPDLSVEMISREIGLSATHLYRKLKQFTGYSTKEIITNYRMQKAADMLQNKHGNVTEIMYAVGFSSLASFSRNFKGRFGVAPSAYVAGEQPDTLIPSPQNP